jgi:formiminotetrahydrofolate cyclodeaminase
LASSDLLEQTVAGLLEEVAAETPAPAGGAAAAISVALGAALVEMVAGFSRSWDGAEAALAMAHGSRARVAALAQADADAYADFLTAHRRPADDSGRTSAIDAALSRVVDIPLEVIAIASEVATLAAALVEHGNPNLRGDAVAGALTAGAGARAAAELVEINLEGRADARLARTRELASSAAEAAERALALSRRSRSSP